MTFSYTTNVRAHAGVTLHKIKTNKLNQKRLPRALYYVCSFFHMPFLYVLSTCSFFHVPFLPFCLLGRLFVCFFKCLSYTFCLVVRFNCIKRAVFKHCNRLL